MELPTAGGLGKPGIAVDSVILPVLPTNAVTAFATELVDFTVLVFEVVDILAPPITAHEAPAIKATPTAPIAIPTARPDLVTTFVSVFIILKNII